MAIGHVHAAAAASSSEELRRRYETADRILPARWKSLVFSGRVPARPLGGEGRFWYASRRRDRVEYVAVDAEAPMRAPLFDLERVADALAAALGTPVNPRPRPVEGVEPRGDALGLHADGRVWLWREGATSVELAPEPAPTQAQSVSPDGRWSVTVREQGG